MENHPAQIPPCSVFHGNFCWLPSLIRVTKSLQYMRFAFLLSLCMAGTALVGCKGNKAQSPNPATQPPTPAAQISVSPQPQETTVIVTPDSAPSGNVAMVNPNARYAVVSFPIGTIPPIGRTLNVYRDGLKVGELKVTGPQRGFNTVADIVAGECQVKDNVREN